MKSLIKRILPKFELYRVYQCQLSQPPVSEIQGCQAVRLSADADYSTQALFKDNAHYDRPNSYGFGLLKERELVAVQWYWHGEQSHQLDWWPLPEKAIMAMHIQVTKKHQGQGLGTTLKCYALNELSKLGFTNVYSRVWHNNKASMSVNRKLGAKQVGWLFCIFGRKFHFKSFSAS